MTGAADPAGYEIPTPPGWIPPAPSPTACLHLNFSAVVQVARVTEEDGALKHLVAEVTVRCTDCDSPMRFLGMPLGLSYGRPMMSPDGEEARLPITPAAPQVASARA